VDRLTISTAATAAGERTTRRTPRRREKPVDERLHRRSDRLHSHGAYPG
jgi:hypothetical protein